ncbi:class E sortase [Salinifilum ghardaiensis]
MPGTAGTRARRGSSRARALRVLGELLILAGLAALLVVVHALYVTDWFTAREQDEATARLQQRWRGAAPPPGGAPPAAQQRPEPGRAFARLHVPAFGPDFAVTVFEGTGAGTLRSGPGHYAATQLPGRRGNFAVAGHRVGRGAAFNDLDQLSTCDALVVETGTRWYVYRVLPVPGEPPPAEDGRCARVHPLGAAYGGAVGRRVVQPERRDVLHPVPGRPRGALPERRRARPITLTTCHPEFSAAERLVVHGVLVDERPKGRGSAGTRPPGPGEG